MTPSPPWKRRLLLTLGTLVLVGLGGALGFVLWIVNTIIVAVTNIYFPYLFAIGAIFWWGGLWLLITGAPKRNPDGSPAPMWARAGLGVCLFLGLMSGISAIFAMHA